MRVGAWSATEPAGTGRRSAPEEDWAGRAVVGVVVVAAMLTLAVSGDGVSGRMMAASRYLPDLRALSDDPAGSVWYLHAHPPLHALLVGLVGRLPLPLADTLFLLYGGALVATGLLLHDVLVRWSTPPLVAGVITSLAMVNPALLATVRAAGPEVPVASLLVASLWAAQRYLAGPSGRRLLLVSATLTAGVLTGAPFRPAWALGAFALVLVARPLPLRRLPARPRQAAAVALGLPLVLVGGWLLKNQVLFGQATLASSSGFDVQRGVVGTMSDHDVRAAVGAGTASPLARRQPWAPLDHYRVSGALGPSCRAAHDHPVTADEMTTASVDGLRIANYNHECYLPLYDRARRDALALAREHPGRWLATRDSGLVTAYDSAPGCVGTPCTWMDRLYQPLLVKLDGRVSTHDWNLEPPDGHDAVDVTLSMTLVVASAAVGWRGAAAAWRLWTTRNARAGWPTDELTWLLAALMVVAALGGATLVGFGENARLRTPVDPLLLTLPLAAAARARRAVLDRPDRGGPAPGRGPTGRLTGDRQDGAARHA